MSDQGVSGVCKYPIPLLPSTDSRGITGNMSLLKQLDSDSSDDDDLFGADHLTIPEVDESLMSVEMNDDDEPVASHNIALPYTEPTYDHNLTIHSLIKLCNDIDKDPTNAKLNWYNNKLNNKEQNAPPVTYTLDEAIDIKEVCILLLNVSCLSHLSTKEKKVISQKLTKWCKARDINGPDDSNIFIDNLDISKRDDPHETTFINLAYGVASTFLRRAVHEYTGGSVRFPPNMTKSRLYSSSKCTQQWGRYLSTIETRNLVERMYLYVSMFMAYLSLRPEERAKRFTCMTERTAHHQGYMTLSIDLDGKSDWHHEQDEATIIKHWCRVLAIVDEVVKGHFDFQYNHDGTQNNMQDPQDPQEPLLPLGATQGISLSMDRDYNPRSPNLPKHAILRRIMARREPFKWHVHYPNIIIKIEAGRAIVGLINRRLKSDPFFSQFNTPIADEALFNSSGLRMLGMNKGPMGKRDSGKIPHDWSENKLTILKERQFEDPKFTWMQVEDELMSPLFKSYKRDPMMTVYLPVDDVTLQRRPLTFDDFISCSIMAPENMTMSKQIKSLVQYAVFTDAGIDKTRDHIVDSREEQQQAQRDRLELTSLGEEMRRKRMDGDEAQGQGDKHGVLLDTHDDNVYSSVRSILDYIRRYDPEVREIIKVFTKPARINIASANKTHLDAKTAYTHKSQHIYWQLSMAGLTQRCHDVDKCSKYCYTVAKFKELPEDIIEFMATYNIFERPRGFDGSPGLTVAKFALFDVYDELMIDPEDLNECTLEFTKEGCELLFPNSQQRLIFSIPKFNMELTDRTKNVPYVYWKNHGEHAIPIDGNGAGALAMLGSRRHWIGTRLEDHFQTILKDLDITRLKITESEGQARMTQYAQLDEIPQHAMFYDKWLNSLSRDLCTGRTSAIADLIYYVAFTDFAYEGRRWWCIRNGRWDNEERVRSYLINVSYNYMVNGFMQATMWYYNTQVEYASVEVKKRVSNGLKRSMNTLNNFTETKDLYRMICQRFDAGGNLYCQSFSKNETLECKMDSIKEYISFENCVWNHKTDWIGEPTPDMYLKICAPINMPLISTPDIESQETFVYNALRPIMKTDEMFDFLMMSIATMFMGENNPATMYIWVGRGSNGKSVLENILQNVFGEYVMDIAPTMFTRAGGNMDSPSPTMVAIKGRRLIIMAEPEGTSLQAALIKRFTGGTEIQGRLLFSNTIVKFVPMAQVVVQCNEFPTVDKFDGGIARRVLIVPFDNQFKMEDEFSDTNVCHRRADPLILDKLKANRQGFLSLLIKYYRKFRDVHGNKLPRPRTILEATENWLCSNDIVYDFKTRFCRPDRHTTRKYSIREIHALITRYFNEVYEGHHAVLKVPSLNQLGERLWSCGYDLEEISSERSPVTRYRVMNTYIRGNDEIEDGENVTLTALDAPYGTPMREDENVEVSLMADNSAEELEELAGMMEDAIPAMPKAIEKEAEPLLEPLLDRESCLFYKDISPDSVLGKNKYFKDPRSPFEIFPTDDPDGPVYFGCETKHDNYNRMTIFEEHGVHYKYPIDYWKP